MCLYKINYVSYSLQGSSYLHLHFQGNPCIDFNNYFYFNSSKNLRIALELYDENF